MYGYFGQVDEMSGFGRYGQVEEMGGLMEIAQKRVFGIPAWGLALAGVAALAYTGKIKLPGMAKKKNPRRRRKNRRSRR